MTCIITGCALVSDAACVWGDLHSIGSAYVFNAVLHHSDHQGQEAVRGEAAWQFGSLPPPLIKQIEYKGSKPFFERRGVIVMAASYCEFNQAAREYLKL